MYGLREYLDDIKMVEGAGAQVRVIGKSTLGNDIHLIQKGNIDGPAVLIHGGIHAREFITTPLLMRLMANYQGKGGIWCIPSVNIDGMRLVEEGIGIIEDKDRRNFLIKTNNMSEDFSMWKANANAVDLNVNFPACWGCGKDNISSPSNMNYIGKYPFSEVESSILAGITYRLQPVLTLSYHTKGEVVYEGYRGNLPYHDMAKKIANYINYDLLPTKDSFGGYKDWFMATTPYLGLTVECGNDLLLHPIGLGELDNLYNRHNGVLELASSIAHDITKERYGYSIHGDGNKRGN